VNLKAVQHPALGKARLEAVPKGTGSSAVLQAAEKATTAPRHVEERRFSAA